MPPTTFGTAVLRCDSDCTCEVNPAFTSSLKPVNSAPGVFVVSKTLRPRLSCGRKYCIAMGRPLVQDSLAAAAAAALAASAASSAVGASAATVAVSDGGGVAAVCCAAAGALSASSAVSAVAKRMM